MRLSSRRWLLLCAGLGLSCAPGSDWPFGSDDERPREPSGGKSDDDGKTPADSDGDSTGDDDTAGDDDETRTPPNEPPTSTKDAGGAKWDAGSPRDAGSSDLLDAGAPSSDDDGGTDGAAGPGCTPLSDGRPYGACFGPYCQMSLDEMATDTEAQGACSADVDLALACDGEIARVVASCAQHEARAIGMGRSILSCARRAATLSNANDECVGCYVDEIVCTVRSCLAACVDGSSTECSECRAARCGREFSACSGLPSASSRGASRPGVGGVDAGR